MSAASPDVDAAVSALIALAAKAAARGFTPATAGNFSVRVDPTRALVTASGTDKGELTPSDAVLFDVGAPLPRRASAEAPVHAAVYRSFPEVTALVHVHTVAATVLSRRHETEGALRIEGLEMLKALRGIATHEVKVDLRIYPNTQDMASLASAVERDRAILAPSWAFLLAGHGLYTWGTTPAEAWRHAEAIDFLLAVRMAEEAHLR